MWQFLIDWMQHSTALFLFFATAWVGALVCSGIHLWKWLHIFRTPTTPISDLKDGVVEIKGRVKALETIPDLSRPSVYYKRVREVYTRRGGTRGGARAWYKESTHEILFPFEVDDGEGMIAVHYENATVDIPEDKTMRQGNDSERTLHTYLVDGSPVYVIGWLDDYEEGRCIGKKSGVPFIISTQKEKDLLIKHACIGFGLLAAAIIAVLCLAIMA